MSSAFDVTNRYGYRPPLGNRAIYRDDKNLIIYLQFGFTNVELWSLAHAHWWQQQWWCRGEDGLVVEGRLTLPSAPDHHPGCHWCPVAQGPWHPIRLGTQLIEAGNVCVLKSNVSLWWMNVQIRFFNLIVNSTLRCTDDSARSCWYQF